jgi:Sulfotransferase family
MNPPGANLADREEQKSEDLPCPVSSRRDLAVKENRKTESAPTAAAPVFVVGMWRSGTSLLYALLNQHPQIALMYEGDLPLLWRLFRNGKAKRDWLERWEFWNGALSRHEIDTRALPAEVPSLRAAMESVYRQHAGLAIWGCKSPNYFDCMTRLAKEFPAGRFIVIYRNPADICRSVIRAGRKSSWFAKSGMSLRALLGYREMKREAGRLAAMGAQIYELQYEDMVRDTAGVLTGICRFLEIPFDPRMVSLEGADRSAIYDAEHHALVKGKQIVAGGRREEILPPPFEKKIARYVNYWREEFAGRWPVYPGRDADSADSRQAGWIERTGDRVIYRSLRAFDRAVACLYCFAPLGMLRLYRNLKRSRLDLPKPEKAFHSASAD